jgi:PASTA domain-containing protein
VPKAPLKKLPFVGEALDSGRPTEGSIAMRLRIGLAVVLGLLAVNGVSACGGDGGGDTTIITQTTTTETTTTDSGSDGGGSDGSGEPSSSGSGSEKVPDLVGERLDVAEDELDSLGIDYKEIGGGTFGIVVRSNWEVCETRPEAGARATTVRLIVERVEEC